MSAGYEAPSSSREVQEALSAITRRLDELAASLAGLARASTDVAAPVGEPLGEAARRQLAAIEAVMAVSPSLGRDPALLLAVDRVVHWAGADCAALFLPTPEGDLEAVVRRGFGGGAPRLRLAEGIVGRAFLEREAIVAGSAHQARDPLLREHTLGQALAVPVRLPDQPALGVLFAGRRRPVEFPGDALGTMVLLADRVALVLAGVAAPPGVRGSEAELSGDLDLARTAATVTRAVAMRLGVPRVALLLLDEDRLRLVGGVGVPVDAVPPEPGAEPIATVLRTGQAWVGSGDAGDEGLACFLGAPPRFLVPLVARGQTVALLLAGGPSPVTPGAITELLVPAAWAIRNARLHAEAVAALAEARALDRRPAEPPRPVRDLGDLLAVLLARIALVRERVRDPALAGDLAVAEEAAWRAVEAVRGVLGFAPGHRGGVLVPLDLAGLVQSVVEEVRARVGARGEVPPGVELDLEPLPPVRGRAEELREALGHLLDNAAEAVRAGGTITVRARWDGGRRVELVVQDSGAGMEQAVRARALDPFFSTKGAGRLGLGLPVAQAILARHRGALELVSAPGQGTTVRLTLPTATGARPGSAGEAGRDVARVLVVEDEAAVRETLVEILAQHGHVALAAADAREGFAIVQRDRLDVVFADLALHDASGLEIARAVKRIHPGTPVILITAWPGPLDPAAVEASGVERVIEKPVGAAEVIAALEAALASRRGTRA